MKKNSFGLTMEHSGGYDIHSENFRHLLEYAPQTVIFQILLNMPQEDLRYFCSINKRVREVCRENNVKAEYYKKHPLARVKNSKEAKAYLKKNPEGFLHIEREFHLDEKDIKDFGDRVLYLDTEYYHSNPGLKFPNLKKDTLYHKGRIEHQRNYKDGKKDGKQYQMYYKGKKWYEENYKDGKLDGKQYEWYKNGQIKKNLNYKDGKKDGKQYKWYDNGEKRYEETYKEGEKHGKQYEWSVEGDLVTKEFKDGDEI